MADKDSAPLVQIDELTKIASIDLENIDNVSLLFEMTFSHFC